MAIPDIHYYELRRKEEVESRRQMDKCERILVTLFSYRVSEIELYSDVSFIKINILVPTGNAWEILSLSSARLCCMS